MLICDIRGQNLLGREQTCTSSWLKIACMPPSTFTQLWGASIVSLSTTVH